MPRFGFGPVTTRFFTSFIFNCLICVYMCLCVIIYPWVYFLGFSC